MGDPSLPGSDPSLQAFSRAALAISRELSLSHVLQQIVDSARDLASARYAALGVFAREGTLSQFIFSGLTAEESRGIGACPTGLGLLRAIVEEGHSIRIPSISRDPRSVGFPSGHPPMETFLGVPIIGAGETLGNLYLTDRVGGGEFSEEDSARIEILAAHAAIALRNARLFHAAVERGQELALRNRELAAINDVARATNERLKLGDLLQAVLATVLGATNADAGVIYLREVRGGAVSLAVHRGSDAQAFQGTPRYLPGRGLPGRVAATGMPLAIDDLAAERGLDQPELLAAGFRSLIYIPLQAAAEIVGVLGVGSHGERVFQEREVAMLQALGQQVGIAIENVRLSEEVGRLAVRDERSRIGMDLHDGVIQSLYAVGLNLDAVRYWMAENRGQAGEQLDQAVRGLNDAIRDIRNFILDLRPRRFEGSLTESLARLVREFQANALIQVDLMADPTGASALPEPIARAVFLTAQECLANIARHARANQVSLRLEVGADGAVLEIQDDGVGFEPAVPPRSIGHGLANMQARAEDLGGTFELQSKPGHGVRVRMTLPVPQP